jgi:GH15 family glucan-1,4-alpha-glucosidase
MSSESYPPIADYWEFLVALVNRACELWRQPDAGLWEMRGQPRHFVQSKVMCWATLDRGIRLANDLRTCMKTVHLADKGQYGNKNIRNGSHG